MSEPTNDYQPINCDFYDHIEILALRKSWVRIEYSAEGESVIEVTKLLSTNTKDKVEYAITEDHIEIRMDQIQSITPLNSAVDIRINLLEKMEYNFWANQKIIQHLSQFEEYPSSASARMSHIINAHDSWNRRILQMRIRFQNWQQLLSDEWQMLLNDIHKESKGILKQSRLDRIIQYVDSKGNTYQSSIADIMYHIINHGTYHRGQISDILSSEGFAAISTDYIVFSIQKHGQV